MSAILPVETCMENTSYLYEFEATGLSILSTKHLVQVETNEKLIDPKELLVEQRLNPKDFVLVRLIKMVDDVYTVLYDINVS